MKKAFTLVELLVVVGILGILIAVLLGTFSGAGESARAAKCQANLHNLGMAVQSYAMESGSYPRAESKTLTDAHTKMKYEGAGWIAWGTDNGGSYISPYEGSDAEREQSLTNGVLWKAIGCSRESYFCPTHQVYAREHNLGQTPLWSYAMNPSVSGEYGSFSRAEATLLFAELPFAAVKNADFTQTGQISGDELDPVLDPKSTKGNGGDEVIGFNHKNGKSCFAHICYADGHVGKLVAPKAGDAQDLTMWLCHPTEKGVDIDISFDGTQYKKGSAEE